MPWYWPFLFPRRLDWLQVEISTHCNAACLYCPRTLYASRWCNRLMPLDLFHRLRPILNRTRLVYLQGWGEPLTHPAFFDFVRLAKAAGCAVGTTTNGMLLTEDLCRRLIESRVDVIALSLAGIDEANDRIRRGTRLRQVLDAIATLNRLKQERGTDTPAIHIAYLLLRSRLDDLEALPAFFSPLGVEQVVVSTLDLVAGRHLADEALIPADDAEYAWLRRRMDAMIASGHALGLSMHAWLAEPHTGNRAGYAKDGGPDLPLARTECTENIHKAAVIGADGGVSPCVYAQLPLSAAVHHWVAGRETALAPLVFGNISRQSFAAIWRSRPYSVFRAAHRAGRPPAPCRICVRMRMRASQQSGSVVSSGRWWNQS